MCQTKLKHTLTLKMIVRHNILIFLYPQPLSLRKSLRRPHHSASRKIQRQLPRNCINPNDPTNYPEDSFEGMVKQAKKKKYGFPYLHDDTQEIAKAYGALKTPHVYLLQKQGESFVVKYIGAIDNNTYEPEKANEKYKNLRDEFLNNKKY